MHFERNNIPAEELIHFYKSILLPRMIEEKMLVLLRQGRISKWFSGIGQEAIAVGATLALQADEWIMPLHRNLGVFTTRKMPLHKLLMQWQGSKDGYSKGRERSFHFGSKEHHICGMISHLGPQLAIADGVALAHKLKKERKVSLAFTGDGGTSEGDFHEALNTAAVWDLPVIFLIENNGYGLSTPVNEQYRCSSLVDKARGYGMEGVKIDGNNVLEVYDTIKGVREYCINNQKPYLIECMTFRMRGHEEASGTKYVPKELFTHWELNDPIKNFELFLILQQVITANDATVIKEELKLYIEEELKTGFDAAAITVDTDEELGDVYAPVVRPETTNLSRDTAGVTTDESVKRETPGVSSDPLPQALPDFAIRPKGRFPVPQSPQFSRDKKADKAESGSDQETSDPSERFTRAGIRHRTRPNGSSGRASDMRFIDAIKQALQQSMQQHPNLVLMGQDIAEYGGAFKITEGFAAEFGKERVRNTPLCESAIVGAALGLSLEGYKSMVEMQFADFITAGFNQVVNNLAKIHYRWGQNADVVIRMPTGGGMGAGPFHSQSNEAWFVHTPGLKVVYPSSAADAKGLLIAAINDPNPVLYFEHKGLYRSVSGAVPEGYDEVAIGKGTLVQHGEDMSIITYGLGVHWAVDYAATHPGISIEILDLRTLLPLDYEAIKETVKKTGKVLLLHEDSLTGGIGAEISAWIHEHYFEYLDAPVTRCASLDTPIPFNPELEKNFMANARLDETVKKLLDY